VSIQTRLLSTQKKYPLYSNSDIPDLSQFNLYDKKRYPYLLMSTDNRENNTQYDILIAFPQYHLTLDSDKTLHCSNEDITTSSGFLETLNTLLQSNKTEDNHTKSSLPFTGGWFVYLSYEMAEEIEPCLSLPRLPSEQPLAVAARCPAAIIFDKKNNQLTAVAEEGYAYLLDELEKDFHAIAGKLNSASAEEELAGNFSLESLVESGSKAYLDQVKEIKRYIVDGDIFQANLSRFWQVTLQKDVTDTDLFKALSIQNPSSFAAMACLENMTIISSSPERLVSVKNGIIETRPIAGTRPRDQNQFDDDALASELLAHPKERAEHIMLIDLERNDLGRVCQPGSVEVNELMVLESWQHVHHIVSNIRGKLQGNVSPVDVLRAVFPGGTITGCPKVHCIEILAEQEQQARGAYTGSLGYINNDGSMDFNILIRTLVRNQSEHNTNNEKTNNRTLSFRAGGGIVNDSIAEKELEETRAKAKGLLKIFNLTENK
jgi:anthranilate synthase component 1